MFRTIMKQLETDPVPLGASHIPSHIPPRRCGGLSFKRPCASRRDTSHERARARDEHQAPPCPLPTRSTRGTRRAITNEPGFVSRVFVVVVSSVVCLGLLQKRQTTAGTVVGNKYTRYPGLVSMFRP